MQPLPVPTDGLNVLLEDNHLLVIDKPAGLLSQSAEAGDDNAVVRAGAYLRDRYQKPGNVYVGLVHRLDRNTSGVLVLARTSKAAARLAEAFSGANAADTQSASARRAAKTYLAVVRGAPPVEGRLEHALVELEQGVRVVAPGTPHARRAALLFRRLAVASDHALLEVTLLTGRKHQIRAQLAAARHPLVGDVRYGPRSPGAPVLPRPALHALRVAFEHPVARTPVVVEAPLPPDLEALLKTLGLKLPA
jgi:23S rRNA pseudouridine1911/1915/1917 synthase